MSHAPVPAGLERLSNSLPADLVVGTLRAAAFWLSVALPAVYVPLLWSGLRGSQVYVFLALLAVHVVSVVLGSEHDR